MPQNKIAPNLRTLATVNELKIPADLAVQWVEDAKGKPGLMVRPTKKVFFVEDEWIIALPGIAFEDGVIEFDALGQSEPPQSNFLGISFRFVDKTTHDAVYFRPFNFRAGDPEREAHAVQYISHPGYHWFNLRGDSPGQYEKPIVPAPDGDSWFHARIVVERPKVSVYVNSATVASLVIDELSDRKGSGVGLWVGPGQGGFFANLTITPAGENLI
jgi:hypothetical protein